MSREDFLNELRYALEGRMEERRVSGIVSQYSDYYDRRTSEGRSEEEIFSELGSPAKLSRALLLKECGGQAESRDSSRAENWQERRRESQAGDQRTAGGRQYRELQKKVNRAAGALNDLVEKNYPTAAKRDLAAMRTRLGAWCIDSVLSFGMCVILLFFFIAVIEESGQWRDLASHYNVSFSRSVWGGWGFMRGIILNYIPVLFTGIYSTVVFSLMGATMAMSTLFMWLTNGYTPGKWLLKIRVVKLSGEKLSFLDALFREFLIKGLANNFLNGLLDLGSFVWGCATEDHKTVQDMTAQTAVVRVKR